MGYKAKIVTDHKALTYLVNKPNPSGRLVQWLLLMEEFNIHIVHRPRRRHDNVMALQEHMKEWVMFQRMTTFQMLQSCPLMQKKHLKNIERSFNI